jgi:predicted dehydrogenase/threonine dehydrogenase-like Zn-dependent dehydrogenase
MQQVIQNLRTGKLTVSTVPEPLARPGHVLIANTASVISAGTEKSAIELAQKSLLGKARERPDQVRRVLEKIRNEGFFTTLQQVMARLDEPMALGYASAGVVLAAGAGVSEFKPGDRVASNGPHAGVVCVPRHLCARVPADVPLPHAAFTVLGAIALQGVRLAKVELGGTALVVGLGLVGQLAVALLRSAGVRVFGTDPDLAKCEIAVKMGAAVARPGLTGGAVEELTGGLGADAVLIAAATKSNEPIELAAAAVRKKGRIVLVGVVGLELDRRPFYFKECEFVVSCSYGPGRYDPEYEERGHDYPAAHVRWTEQRNMQAVLDLMASGTLNVEPLISHRFAIDRAEEAYQLIQDGKEPYLGILLEYPETERRSARQRIEMRAPRIEGTIGFGCLGAGNFARTVLLPQLAKTGKFRPVILCSAGGVSAAHTGDKFGFEAATADEAEVFRDPQVQAVFILTRHDQHGRQVVASLRAGKHTFTEKPLCLTLEELEEIERTLAEAARPPLLMVGFNRRFSPITVAVNSFFADWPGPRTVSIRFNAGAIPPDHWTQSEAEGGGRLIGEACHGIDLATALAGAPPVRVFAESVGGPDAPAVTDDQCFITLRHANGSVSSVAYLAGGDRSCPKERVEVFGGGRVALIEDFREVRAWKGGKTRRLLSRWRQEKGHREELEAFAGALTGGSPAPIPWDELRAVTLASILAVQSLREGVPFEAS